MSLLHGPRPGAGSSAPAPHLNASLSSPAFQGDHVSLAVCGLRGMMSLKELHVGDELKPVFPWLSRETTSPLCGNHISLVCGLRGMMSLEELHISDQKLPEHVSLEFDPFAVQEVAHSLRKLVAVNSNIKDECLSTLGGLRDLRSLELAANAISSFEAVEGVVEGAPYLLHIDLKNNPICKNFKYRETMIIMSDSLRTIDGHEVVESQRQSLLRLQVKKMKMEQKAEERALRSREAAAGSPATNFSGGLDSKPLPAGSVNAQAQAGQFVQPGGLRGATASGRSDLIGSPAGYGQPRHFAKQASQHQPRTMGSTGGQQGLGVTGSASARLAGALDGLQL
ncbi:hypothetical protein DUNSADRAFT_2569 [Dunaliella salina]|uniref:Uncharacterized protein n=1 Tax=Dunaliella salina TaxID=3046 RepID=A0ABQ7GVH2_DUNSA|nr:hypothetical protein DUNSADRAFT_2569 [Dunaliella salina]|eukprot:KAF5838585.1 hypothetical protein DUNSADRAFT_2569 [Dunaliella salina]